jgi:predicted dehydrogenase
MKKDVYRVGIIGLGRIGFTLGFDQKREQPASHSRAFGENKRIGLAGGFDTDRKKLAAWKAAYPKARAYESIKEMMNDGFWDIVVIAVPEEAHLSVFSEVCLYTPRLVVLEKPVAAGLDDALSIQRLAKEFRVPVCVNHERRFSADYIYVKKLLDSRKLGAVRLVSGYMLSSVPAIRPDSLEKGKGALVHDSTHLIDSIRFLTGKRLSVEAVTVSGKSAKGETAGITAAGTCGDAAVTINVGYRSKAFVFELDIVLEKGRVRIGNGLFEVYRALESPYYEKFYSLALDGKTPVFKKTGYFSGMVQNCVDFLDGMKPLSSALDDGIETMRVIGEIVGKAGE